MPVGRVEGIRFSHRRCFFGPTPQWCRRKDRRGRLIRHARLAAAAPILLLAITVILPSFRTLLVAPVGAPMLSESGCGTAVGTAITLSAITVFTDPENGVTPFAQTDPLTQNQFAVNCHARRLTGSGQ